MRPFDSSPAADLGALVAMTAPDELHFLNVLSRPKTGLPMKRTESAQAIAPPGPRVLSLGRCREILGPGVTMSDEDLVRLRAELYGLARLLVDRYHRTASATGGA